MIGDMAVKHPVTWLIGNECNLGCFLGWHQDSVGPLPMRDLRSISAKNTEAVAVEMNRMPPCRVVIDFKSVASTKFQGQQRRHSRVAFTGHRLTVDGPHCAVGHSTHSTHSH